MLNFNSFKATVDNYESIEDAMSVDNLEPLKKLPSLPALTLIKLKKLLPLNVPALIELALQEVKVHYNPSRYVYDLDQCVSSSDDKKTFIRETYHRKSVSKIDLEKNRNGTFTTILQSELPTKALLNLLEIERPSESRVIMTRSQSGSDNAIMDQLQNNRQESRYHQIISFWIASNGNQVTNAVAREVLQANEESGTNQHEAHSRSSLKSLKAKYQWAKSSGHSRHSSTGVSRQLRKEYQGSGSDADNSGSQVMSAVISAFVSGHFSKPIFIPYDTLMQATKNFDEKKVEEGGSLIAAGSFGQVFLGDWQGQQVAVKRLKKPKNERLSTVRLSKRQYMNEVSALTMCRPHPNVVRLIGICDDGPELCLVYEYVEGRTLAQPLAKESREPLNWSERIEMAHDIASSIHHIQSTSQRPLIHRDVKSSNILASCDRRVRLADFGLSCFGEHLDNMHASFLESGSTTVGTRCYMPPEAFKGIFSTRTDAYSFGMVLFELVTGLPPYSSSKKLDLATFLKQIEGEGTELVAMSDPQAAWPDPVSNKLIDLAKRCTDMDSHRRPFIKEVLKELRGIARMERYSSRKV
ncbi:uncharacterized protein LOC134188326 [Corticium candelabrum]|uniref:uncharacterized protein LOC134188326 n=1 Tax=Corticium candelabrum TaxID=121492 RepID=UPI002E25ED18|nr:uncharacterized protein LOC134188326 [Corticium candelabrum]